MYGITLLLIQRRPTPVKRYKYMHALKYVSSIQVVANISYTILIRNYILFGQINVILLIFELIIVKLVTLGQSENCLKCKILL